MKKILSPNFTTPTPRYFRTVASIQTAAPFKNVSAMFNWVNTYYPIEHTHTHWEFLVIISGKTRHTINNQTTIMSRGDACLIRPKDKHRLDPAASNEAFQHITIALSPTLFKNIISPYNNYDEFNESSDPCYFSLNESTLENLVEKILVVQALDRLKYEQNTILLFHSLVLNYLEYTLNNDATYPDWLNQFLQYINSPTHFNEKVETLAKHSPYNHSALTRVFKQYMGVSIIKYINQIKMAHAKRLLRTSDLTMLEISFELGYESLSTFNHNFKRAFGIAPTEYRKTHSKLQQNSEFDTLSESL